MKDYTIIELKDILLRFEELRFKEPINWIIKSNEHWVIVTKELKLTKIK